LDKGIPAKREDERVENRQRLAVGVRGVVQGVGFRPFVYRLAQEEGLAGFIGNDTDGVTIEVEGEPERAQAFVRPQPVQEEARLADY